MRVLITGATGIIGSKLADSLMQVKNYNVIILTRSIEPLKSQKKYQICHGDLLDHDSLIEATLNVDTVIHLAAVTHTNQQSLYYKINTKGTENLLRACHQNNVKKFIFISSRTASQDGGAYARSKMLAENMVEQFINNWIILSPAEVYGADAKEAVSKIIRLINKSYIVPIIGNGQCLLSPVHVDDVVNAIITSVRSDKVFRKKYILAGPAELTYTELVDCLSAVMGKKVLKVNIPLFLLNLLAFLFFVIKKDFLVRDQIPRLLCKKLSDISAAGKDLNYNPRNFESGIRELV